MEKYLDYVIDTSPAIHFKKQRAKAELAALREKAARLEEENDKLKKMCAKAYADIYGGVRMEIYDFLGDEIGVLLKTERITK